MSRTDGVDRCPAITGVLSGPENTIWVQRMGSVDEIDPWGINAPNRAEWLGGREGDVLDNNGRALGSVHLPPGFRPNNIVGRLIVRVQKDELEVERVAVLEIR